MKILTITALIFLLCIPIYAQDLSLHQSFLVTIEKEEDIPVVSENEDNTVSVTFKKQHINEIFSKYKVYSFKKWLPKTTSEKLKKVYSFTCNSRAFVNELVKNVSSDVLFFDFPFDEEPVDDEMKLNFRNPQKFSLESYAYTSEEACHDFCDFTNVATGDSFTIEIVYDDNKDAITMKSIGETPLGVDFTFYFKNFKIRSNDFFGIWETNANKKSILSNQENARKPEYLFFQMIFAHVQLMKFQKIDDKTLIIRNPNAIFGEDVFQFSSGSLSTKEGEFNNYIEISSNPIQNQLKLSLKDNLLKISNVSVYDSLGKKVINKDKNFSTINTSQLQAGLYFLQVYLDNNVILRKKLIK